MLGTTFELVRRSWMAAPVTELVCRRIAAVAGMLLVPVSRDLIVVGDTIRGAAGTLRVGQECSGSDLMALLAAAIIAYPVSWKRRVVGVLLVAPFVLALNVVRVASLVLLLAYDRRMFEFGHTFAWQGILLIASLGFWVVWSRGTIQPYRGVTIAGASAAGTVG